MEPFFMIQDSSDKPRVIKTSTILEVHENLVGKTNITRTGKLATVTTLLTVAEVFDQYLKVQK